MTAFALTSAFQPQGDQPQAIRDLLKRLDDNHKNSVLLGVTGSGKTFTMAHVIAKSKRPALILAHNKTLAAQLYAEMKALFPHNAVEYFVSYYDYYQPEAFVPRTGTYIEKEATINQHIDRMRHSATRALLERKDVIVVASVSCIYGIGAAEDYAAMKLRLKKNEPLQREEVIRTLVELQYKRNDLVLERGKFRFRGDTLDVFPAHYEDRAWRVSMFDDVIESIVEFDPLTGSKTASLDQVTVYPNSHYVIPHPTMQQALKEIKKDLALQLKVFAAQKKLVEEQRLRERVTFDIESMTAMGSCAGIENYSRYFTGRQPGEPPPTLFEYLPKDALLIVDESHVTVPQLRAMYKGDAARKANLANYGFRLPACADNRPLKFEEWDAMRPQTLFVSATPGPFELEATQGVVAEQVIRPTGLMDPVCQVKATAGQVDDLMFEAKKVIQKSGRVLVTTLTKKMAEALQEYMTESGFKTRYIHADVDTIERIDIIQQLRAGTFDMLIGINLLREGLDIPECSLVAIMDADKEGYLRSHTALIQTMGRAARHLEGRVILYADKITHSMRLALDETERRRTKQMAYNKAHNITPQGIQKDLSNILESVYEKDHTAPAVADKKAAQEGKRFKTAQEKKRFLKRLEKDMLQAAEKLDFEKAAALRDQLHTLEKQELL
ncbi:MAG: excinuclease ABC subunit UvrB [Holosporaceae bacterium]